MTSAELGRVLTSVDKSIEASRQQRVAARYVRDNIETIVGRLRDQESTTFESSGRQYTVNREQLRRALR